MRITGAKVWAITSMDKQNLLINLRQALSTRLSEEELRSLCFDIGVDYENLGGESKAAHARNLISLFERRERLEELVTACQTALPDLPWDKLLDGITSASTLAPTWAQHLVGKVKILFLAANPVDTPMLRLDQEVRLIDQTLRQAEFRGNFELIQHWAIRVSDLQSCLLRHTPHIVHFSGHGSALSEIVLETDAGLSQTVPAAALSRLFGLFKQHLRCVVLNACYTHEQALGIAEQIDCVIGMSQAIQDQAGCNFSAAFYQALAYGRDVQTAFELGCLQLDLQGLSEGETPQLIAKLRDPRMIFFV